MMMDTEKPIWYDDWVIFENGDRKLKPNAPDWVKEEYELFARDIYEPPFKLSQEAKEEFLKKLEGLKQ